MVDLNRMAINAKEILDYSVVRMEINDVDNLENNKEPYYDVYSLKDKVHYEINMVHYDQIDNVPRTPQIYEEINVDISILIVDYLDHY